MRIFEICLFEYKRDITIQKLGDKLASAGKKDGNNKLERIIDVLEQIDPTRNKQYVEWLSKQYIKGQFRLEDYPRINELLINFEKVKSRLQQKDINRYDLYSLTMKLIRYSTSTSTLTLMLIPTLEHSKFRQILKFYIMGHLVCLLVQRQNKHLVSLVVVPSGVLLLIKIMRLIDIILNLHCISGETKMAADTSSILVMRMYN